VNEPVRRASSAGIPANEQKGEDMDSASDLATAVTWFSLVAGSICLAVGLVVAIIEALRHREVSKEAKDAVQAAVSKAKQTPSGEDLAAQGAIGDTMESLAKLATALKDLDVGTRILVLGVALYAIAGIAAGLDSVAAAVDSSTGSDESVVLNIVTD
jgi:hypothetical protein